MLKHWAIASLSLRDKPPVGSQRMRSGGDQADREELREKACLEAWRVRQSSRMAAIPRLSANTDLGRKLSV